MHQEVFSERDIELTRNFLKLKVMKKHVMHTSYEKQYNTLYQTVKRTIDTGESDSLVLIGPRGSGKTKLVADVLRDLRNDLMFQQKAEVVELNGFVHTDDRLSLKDITKQLKLEMLVKDKVFKSLAENLSFLLECLQSGNKEESKSTIFIVEEFDLFCARGNQTLVYSLFDVAQASLAPICVVGLTSTYDVLEVLDERVKSRFTRRQIYLKMSPVEGFEARMKLLEELLLLPNFIVDSGMSHKHIVSWNDNIKNLLQNKDFVNLMKEVFEADISDSAFRTFVMLVISQLSVRNPSLSVNNFRHIHTFLSEDSKINILSGLSVLELSLIIAIKHFDEIYHGEPFNFELILRQYMKFVNSNSSVLVSQRSVIMKAFERLKDLELIALAEGEIENANDDNASRKRKESEFRMHHLLLTNEEINEAVNNFPNLPTEVKQWASSSIS